MGEGSLNENHALSLNPNNREAGVYDYRIYVYDEYGSSAASAYEGTMTLPANTFIPANLTVSPAGGNTYEISWDVATGVDRYFVDCRDNYDNLMLYGYFTPDELTVVGGKYVLKTGTALVSGMGYCHVEGYAANETYRRGSSILYFDITLVNLGAVTVRVLIPSDNNMDISNGVWIGWRHAGMDMDHYEYAQATEKSDRWFEASFTVPAISYQFFVLNESTSGANTQATTLATSYEAQSCYEMLFSMNGSFWKLPDADCNAPDHDYRIKNVKTESAGGEVTFTVEAKDYAKYYYVYARKKGTDDEFENVGYCESDGKSAVIEATFFINEDTEYDYKIYVTNTDRYNCVTEVYEGVVTVTKNPSAPADLKATVAPDGQTVIFSWTQDSQSKAAYYYILVVDEAIGSVRAEIPYIEGTTASTKLYISSDYYWYIYALDKDYNVLGLVQSSEYFKITAGKDLRPTNLKAVVNDQTVTLSWETEPEITQCKYYLYCTTEGRDFHALATSTNGKYSVTFTPPVGIYGNYEWSVAAATEDSYYTISQWVDGTDFTIEAPATPVTETYSIELYSVGGGSVNDIDGDYPKGTQLDIIAKPYDDYTFKEWSDGSKEAIRTITLTQDTVLTAYFVSAYINYTLTVTADEGGTVNDVSGTYPAATLIELVATPNSGYKFKEWSDGSTDAERTIWLYSDTDLVAIFEKDGGVTQLDEIRSQESGIRKVLINGQIYILRDDKIYTVQGQLVK